MSTKSSLTTNKEDPAQYRFERKFLSESIAAHGLELESLLYQSEGSFSSLYAPRYVNNLYLDHGDFRFFHHNVDGNSHQRMKVRIRWYGALFGRVTAPKLEIKIRQGEVNRKQSYALPTLEVGEHETNLVECLENARLPKEVALLCASLQPVLLNRYRRYYYLSYDRQYRATLDDALAFHLAPRLGRSALAHVIGDSLRILEIKYPTKSEGLTPDRLTQGLPFRLTRSSKYAMGVAKLFGAGWLLG